MTTSNSTAASVAPRSARASVAELFPRPAQFRETPLPPPTRPPKRKRLPKPITKEARLAEICAAREALDEADRIVRCMRRQVYVLRAAIGRDATQHGEHAIIALETMATSTGEKLKAARAKLNTLETLELHGSYIAVRP